MYVLSRSLVPATFTTPDTGAQGTVTGAPRWWFLSDTGYFAAS
jgi:hypothetical protein